MVPHVPAWKNIFRTPCAKGTAVNFTMSSVAARSVGQGWRFLVASPTVCGTQGGSSSAWQPRSVIHTGFGPPWARDVRFNSGALQPTQLYHGRVRLEVGLVTAAMTRRASFASSSICQSNMPTRIKSAPLLKA